MSIGLIGKKIGMTREFFDSGISVPVTVLSIERGRIIATLSIHDNMRFPKPGSFDWKKIVYERIKNGKPASI